MTSPCARCTSRSSARMAASRRGPRGDARRKQAAKARLPPDTRSLVLIMSDIGRGGMNASAIDDRTGPRGPRGGARAAARRTVSADPRRQVNCRHSIATAATGAPPAACNPGRIRTHRAASCRHRPAMGRQGRRPGHPDHRRAVVRRPARRARSPDRWRAARSRRIQGAEGQALHVGTGAGRRAARVAGCSRSAQATRTRSIARSRFASAPPPSDGLPVASCAAWRSGCRRSSTQTGSMGTSRRPPSSSLAAWSRAPTTRRRSTARRSSRRRRSSTSSS